MVHRGQLVYSVKRAQKCLQTIDPDLCARYVKRGARISSAGGSRWHEIGGEVSAKEALAELRLAPAGRVFNSTADRSLRDEAAPVIMAGAAALPRFETMNQMPERAIPGLTPSSRA